MIIQKTDFTFFHPLRVRWSECDPQNIVFFANYFIYFDLAVTEYFRELGFDFTGEDGLEFYTVHAGANYQGSAVFDDALEVGARVARLGETSVRCVFAIFRGDELLVDGETIYVNAVRNTKDKAPLPERFISRVKAFEKTPPDFK